MTRKQKYLLNTNTGTLHIEDGCCHAKGVTNDFVSYFSEDEAIKDNQRYMKHCRFCFKNR